MNYYRKVYDFIDLFLKKKKKLSTHFWLKKHKTQKCGTGQWVVK